MGERDGDRGSAAPMEVIDLRTRRREPNHRDSSREAADVVDVAHLEEQFAVDWAVAPGQSA